jgi:hypothetical protein
MYKMMGIDETVGQAARYADVDLDVVRLFPTATERQALAASMSIGQGADHSRRAAATTLVQMATVAPSSAIDECGLPGLSSLLRFAPASVLAPVSSGANPSTMTSLGEFAHRFPDMIAAMWRARFSQLLLAVLNHEEPVASANDVEAKPGERMMYGWKIANSFLWSVMAAYHDAASLLLKMARHPALSVEPLGISTGEATLSLAAENLRASIEAIPYAAPQYCSADAGNDISFRAFLGASVLSASPDEASVEAALDAGTHPLIGSLSPVEVNVVERVSLLTHIANLGAGARILRRVLFQHDPKISAGTIEGLSGTPDASVSKPMKSVPLVTTVSSAAIHPTPLTVERFSRPVLLTETGALSEVRRPTGRPFRNNPASFRRAYARFRVSEPGEAILVQETRVSALGLASTIPTIVPTFGGNAFPQEAHRVAALRAILGLQNDVRVASLRQYVRTAQNAATNRAVATAVSAIGIVLFTRQLYRGDAAVGSASRTVILPETNDFCHGLGPSYDDLVPDEASLVALTSDVRFETDSEEVRSALRDLPAADVEAATHVSVALTLWPYRRVPLTSWRALAHVSLAAPAPHALTSPEYSAVATFTVPTPTRRSLDRELRGRLALYEHARSVWAQNAPLITGYAVLESPADVALLGPFPTGTDGVHWLTMASSLGHIVANAYPDAIVRVDDDASCATKEPRTWAAANMGALAPEIAAAPLVQVEPWAANDPIIGEGQPNPPSTPAPPSPLIGPTPAAPARPEGQPVNPQPSAPTPVQPPPQEPQRADPAQSPLTGTQPGDSGTLPAIPQVGTSA